MRCYVGPVPEHEPPEFEQCAVCGRTMLRGERLWDYVTSGGESRRVCALCKPQAEAAGWLPRELAGQADAGPERASRARAFRERLGRVAEQARAHPAEAAPPVDAPEEEAEQPRRRRRLFVEREPQTATDHEDAAASSRSRSIAEARPADPQSRARRAADRFNASEARRTVAGLTRSLGEPRASIKIANKAGDTKVTIAWELSWYQWEVDPGEHGAVREVRKGSELDELSDAEREWNARVADDGSLRLSAA
jgi:hypothetical protein